MYLAFSSNFRVIFENNHVIIDTSCFLVVYRAQFHFLQLFMFRSFFLFVDPLTNQLPHLSSAHLGTSVRHNVYRSVSFRQNLLHRILDRL